MDISVAEAASRLGLSAASVRRLAHAGELSARKVGGLWLIADSDVAASAHRVRGRGRPLSARSAWAVIALLSGDRPEALSRSELARARKRAARAGDLAPGELAHRARVHRLHGPPGVQERLVNDRRLVRAGVSASREAGLGIVAPHRFEGYVRPKDLARVARDHGLQPSAFDRANVVLRVPEPRWPFGQELEVPAAVAALDVLDEGDSRSVDEARRVLTALAGGLT